MIGNAKVEHCGPHVRKDAVPMQTSPRMIKATIRGDMCGRVLGSAKTCEKKKAGIPRVEAGIL